MCGEIKKQIKRDYCAAESSNAEHAAAVNVYPGIELAFCSFYGEKNAIQHNPEPFVMHINHCRRGRIGWKMKDGSIFYMGPGDLFVHMMDCCCDSEINLPLGFYEGMCVAVDLEMLTTCVPEILKEAGVNGKDIYKKLFKNGKPVTMPASDRIEHIFAQLYELPENICMPYYKLKVQELILFLNHIDVSAENVPDRHLSSQVETIRDIHQLLVSHLERRYTIEELARKYLINTSSLKKVFKAVYGLPVASYMKNYRLKQAALLLQRENSSIAEIAAKVGYENQSKFTKAFKEMYHVLPTEYRRQMSK